ncbi:MAG: DEAD/DEAH box helicase family protein [Thermomicrobiales bacterium]|nr:DEAD/DEAH box helicase family protein [Thermomicrobiales bacterium]
MQLKFDADLPFQRAAIDAVLGVFAGQPLADGGLTVAFHAGPLLPSELGVGNALTLDDTALLANVQRVQAGHGLPAADRLESRDFAIEMETGTGKTYVFLRTAFELQRTYGFTKFIIVVPSVAIREGVLHAIRTMRGHFRALYATPFDAAVYDSKRLGRLRAFATGATLQFLVINIQAFQRDAGADEASGNVIYREHDRLSGHAPIEFLRATNPVVIIDEPQKLGGEASTAAIARLNPLCTLRYSATYEHPNKLYRLGPIEALDQKLVKRIEVASVVEEKNFNEAFVRLLKTDAKKQTAQVAINVAVAGGAKQKKVTVRAHDDLFVKSAGRPEYRDGYLVNEISFAPGHEWVGFGNGVRVAPGAAVGGLDDDVMREQVRETVREHLEKERVLRPHGIKTLSLFFIDKVANYRQYDPATKTWRLGKIGVWFEEAFRELSALPEHAGLIADPVERVHGGYFSGDKKGGYKDTRGDSQDDAATYELIMRDKERLLSFAEPLRFIFSHSALREGWDNPNVFQICTLNESRSVVRKRQEIGRGLRLPVNQAGERVRDEQINRLTVVANEAYKVFAEQLQTEYAEDAGIQFGVAPREAFAAIVAGPADAPVPLGHDASAVIWEHLRQRGYLDAEGRVQEVFAPGDADFVLDVPEPYEALRPQIADAIARYVFTGRVANKRRRATVQVRQNVLRDDAFRALWDRIARKTRYRIDFDTDELVRSAAERMRQAPQIFAPVIRVEHADLEVTYAGVAETMRAQRLASVRRDYVIPDLLTHLQNATDLTRQTLARILIASGRVEDARVNPQAFIEMAEREIKDVLQDLMLLNLEYEPVGAEWDIGRLEQEGGAALVRYLDNLYKVQNAKKSPFDYIEYQSKVEEAFARDLDNREDVKFFVKLPAWFKVDTPLGDYNPDWAILMELDGEERLYLVRETKGSADADALRGIEAKKIACGRKHFAALGVDFGVTTTVEEMLRPVLQRAAAR